MVGLGTGIAPLRAMVQDRAVAKANGEKCGQMALFFGNRNKKNEFLYENEFNKQEKDGVMDFYGAWSRDQPEKIQVHHLMHKKENQELIQDLLHKQGGQQQLCGPNGPVAECRDALVDAYVNVGGHSREEADQMITKMQIEGRYNLDTW